MRFIVTDDEKVSLTKLESGLKKIDENYFIEREVGDETEGELFHNNEIYCQIEVNIPGDDLFVDEIDWLIEELDEIEDADNKQEVLNSLNNAKAIFCVSILNQGRDDESTFEKIDPLWDWFFEYHRGLLKADMEGYYNASKELILEV